MNLTEEVRPGTVAAPTGAPPSPVPSPDDPRVVRALKAGQRPDPREFQVSYPQVAEVW